MIGTDDITKLNDIFARILQQRVAAIQYLTFIKDITDNNARWNKYKSSYSGHVIHLAVISIENSLLMFCDRVWDVSRDSQSIPNAVQIFAHRKREIIDRRSSDNDAGFIPNWRSKIEALVDEVEKEANKIRDDPVRRVLRVIRSEKLSHLVEESRDRRNYFPDGFENHNVKKRDLLIFSERTIRLIEKWNP